MEPRRFITKFTSTRHLSLSWARSIQSMPSYPTSWRSVLILSSHLRLGHPSGPFPSGFPTKTLYTPLLSTSSVTCNITVNRRGRKRCSETRSTYCIHKKCIQNFRRNTWGKWEGAIIRKKGYLRMYVGLTWLTVDLCGCFYKTNELSVYFTDWITLRFWRGILLDGVPCSI